MVTFQAGRIALAALLLGLVAACSSEQQDWHSAQIADTSEAWQRFIEQHPESELAAQARLRIVQLEELHDWQRADSSATVDAYRSFLARHPNGRWSEQARIRIEAFSLGSAPRIAPETPAQATAAPEARGVRALQLATGTPAAPAAVAEAGEALPAVTAQATAEAPTGTAQPGEAAQPLEPPRPAEVVQPAGGAQADEAARTGEVSPPAASAAPAPIAAAVPVGGYGVQLGAFGNPTSADHEWQRLQVRFAPQLAGLSPRIVVASTGLGQLYRLQASATGEAQARAICDTLKEQSQACVPVLPR